MIRSYYYNAQLKKAAMVFANIFTGLKVRTGKDGCGVVTELPVPVRYGATDRVAGAIAAHNTQNALHTLPMMSAYMTGIELAPERQKGIGSQDRRTYLPQGGAYPDDVQVIQRTMPIPYNLTFELSVYASNTDQAFQILEQILILFDYSIQVQFNDAAFDWAKITSVILDSGPRNETIYPVGTDRQVIVWTFPFTFETWLSPPMEVRNDLIHQIMVNIGDMDGYVLEEYDEDGNLIPFEEDYGSFVVGVGVGGPSDFSEVDPANPGMVSTHISTGHYDPSMDNACSAQPAPDGSNPLPG
jgi:hypothetical protein